MQRWFAVGLCLSAVACDLGGAEPAEVRIQNGLGDIDFTLIRTVYQDGVWTEPIPAGSQSSPLKVEAGYDYGYALAVRAFDPAAGPPQVPQVIRTRLKVESVPAVALDLLFSEKTVVHACNGLSAAEYDHIRATVFPTEAVLEFEAVTCATAD